MDTEMDTETYEALTPAERAELDEYLNERAAEALAYQMEVDAPYDTPPWATFPD